MKLPLFAAEQSLEPSAAPYIGQETPTRAVATLHLMIDGNELWNCLQASLAALRGQQKPASLDQLVAGNNRAMIAAIISSLVGATSAGQKRAIQRVLDDCYNAGLNALAAVAAQQPYLPVVG